MTDFEYKSLKVLEKLLRKSEVKDPDMYYCHISEDPDNDMVVTIFVSSFDYYRASIPYTAFGNAGGSVMITWPFAKEEIKYLENSKFFILNKIISIEYFEIVYEYAKKINAILIYDLDDNIHEVNETNYSYDIYNPNTELGRVKLYTLENIISRCDCVMYSTRELQSYYETLNPNSIVMPNFLDVDKRYKDIKPANWKILADEQNIPYNDQTILIGFFGSDSHIGDLSLLEFPIMEIIKNNPNVLFTIMAGSDLILTTLIKKWKIANNKFLYMPYQNINEYLSYVACFDIGLAPLHNNIFNLCKSNLKLLEYGALGIPYVASKVANFQRFQIESKQVGGFTCDDQNEWIERINFLIDNPDIRKKMGQSLKQYVYNQYDIKNSLVLISNVLRTINENHNKTRHKPNIFELVDCYDNIPRVKIFYLEDDICPCGSGNKYISCKNNCYPAWGEIMKEDKCQLNN